MKKFATVLSSRPSCLAIVACISFDGRFVSLKMAWRVRRWMSVKTRRGFLGVRSLGFTISVSFCLQATTRQDDTNTFRPPFPNVPCGQFSAESTSPVHTRYNVNVIWKTTRKTFTKQCRITHIFVRSIRLLSLSMPMQFFMITPPTCNAHARMLTKDHVHVHARSGALAAAAPAVAASLLRRRRRHHFVVVLRVHRHRVVRVFVYRTPTRVHEKVGHRRDFQSQLLSDRGLHLLGRTFGFLENGIQSTPLNVSKNKSRFLGPSVFCAWHLQVLTLTSWKERQRPINAPVIRLSTEISSFPNGFYPSLHFSQRSSKRHAVGNLGFGRTAHIGVWGCFW